MTKDDAQVLLDLLNEMIALAEAGEQAPPPLAARVCRLMPADDYRLEFRVMLHVAARVGDEDAVEVLRLLADDPWWNATPPVMRLWPAPM